MFATIRPDSWNPALFVHVLAGMVLVGVLVAGAVALLASSPHDSARLRRFAFRSLLFAGLPAFIAMIVSGEWIADKEGLGGEDDPVWFIIGIAVGDLSGLLLAVSLLLLGIASWKSKARLSRIAGALVSLALFLSLVGVWAMTVKPS